MRRTIMVGLAAAGMVALGVSGTVVWRTHAGNTTAGRDTSSAPRPRDRRIPPPFKLAEAPSPAPAEPAPAEPAAPAEVPQPRVEEKARVFRHPFWAAVGSADDTNIEGLLDLAKRMDVPEDGREMLRGIFPTLKEAASLAAERQDRELGLAVQEEVERTLLALSDSDGQTKRVQEFFSITAGE